VVVEELSEEQRWGICPNCSWAADQMAEPIGNRNCSTKRRDVAPGSEDNRPMPSSSRQLPAPPATRGGSGTRRR